MSDHSPTVLTIADIDNFVKQFEESMNSPEPMTHCPSCEIEIPLMMTDYYTGQCRECFIARKPWCHSAPVANAYFIMTEGE